MNLRPYQRDASDCVVSEWTTVGSTLVVMPTGLGKTILFADLIRRMFPKRAMVIAHREELIFQAVDKIKRTTGLSAEIEMADHRVEQDGLFGGPHVIVSTVQTHTAGGDGGGRMGKFTPEDFGLLIIDEAHHACAGTYKRVIDYYRQNPDLRVLGVTATPDRADEEALGQIFESVAYDYEILDAIHQGWLVPINQQLVSVGELDYSGIRTTAGDLNGADLAKVLEQEKILHGIASPAVEIIGDRHALVFTGSVAQAEALCEIFNRHHPKMAEWVCGKTAKDDRRAILARFATGETQVVCNCGVLTEGFDDPGVEVIIMARPTKSRALYAQMIGRATRPLPGIVDGPETAEERCAAIAASPKPCCLVVDFVGNAGRHKLMTSADILGGKVSDEVVEAATLHARKTGKPCRMDELIESEEKRITEERKAAEEARRARLVVGAKWTTQTISPFDAFGLHPVKSRGWDVDKSLTEKQQAVLLKQGIDPGQLTYAEGRQVLNEMFRRWNENLCSYKQARILRKYGYPTDCTRDAASKILDQLKVNGWRKVKVCQ